VPCERLIIFSETGVNEGDLDRTVATVAATFKGFFQESFGAGALVQRHVNVGFETATLHLLSAVDPLIEQLKEGSQCGKGMPDPAHSQEHDRVWSLHSSCCSRKLRRAPFGLSVGMQSRHARRNLGAGLANGTEISNFMSATSKPKQKRKPRIHIPDSPVRDWGKKVHPLYVRMVEYDNHVAKLLASPNEADRAEGQRLADNPSPELIDWAQRLHDARPESERPRANARLLIYGVADAKERTTISDEQFTLGWLAFNKFGKSIVELTEGNAIGDEKSRRQLASVTKGYQDWRYGKFDPNKMRSKFDRQHILLIRVGLGLGIESLSQEELADCFDALCRCGGSHDPENLRKLKTRVIEILDRLAHNPIGRHG
jgi:hypothetical protein